MGLNENVSAWLDAAPDQVRETTQELLSQVEAMRDAQTIYPPQDDILNALAFTAPADVRVVILGQDPYHGPGQAMGLSFSVPCGCKLPPSLRNMYKEMAADLGCPMPESGDLTSWAAQGVLLLNTTLTVREHAAASHAKLGWRVLIDHVVRPCQQACAQEHASFAAFGQPCHRHVARVHGVAAVFPGQSHFAGSG